MESPDREMSNSESRDASGGDPLDVNALIAQHLPSLNAYMRLRTGAKLSARESISDLVQSTCREALGSVEKVPDLNSAEFKYWLFTVAERKIKKKVRYWDAEKRTRSRETGPMQPDEQRALLQSYGAFQSPSHGAVIDDELASIETAMEDLPDDQREVVLLHCMLEVPHREIAERLGRNEAAVRQTLSRALARLARQRQAEGRDHPR